MVLSNNTTLILVAVIFLIVGGLLAMAVSRAQRTRRLKERFGPEYDRAVKDLGDKRQAEDELEARVAHVQKLDIRALTPEEVNRFSLQWQAIQAEFVDEPHGAVQKANRLIREVMQTRGYPVDDFEQRAADISVDYPELVSDYRGLHMIAVKDQDDQVSTEEMRQAMIHGRDLFQNLVQPATEEEVDQKERV